MDLDDYFRFLLALVFVIGLIGILAVLIRRFGSGGTQFLNSRMARGRRLGIVETLTIDARRRLVLLRRDNKEHLVLLGASQELLIESEIPGETPELEASERRPLASIVRGSASE